MFTINLTDNKKAQQLSTGTGLQHNEVIMTQTNKKYELLDSDTVTTASGRVLKRIRALVAIGTLVASGELGA